MKIRRALLVAAFAFLNCAAPFASAESPAVAAQLDALGKSLVKEEAPGAAIVAVRSGQPIYIGVFGVTDLKHREPVDRETAFHLASVGKQITAVAILKLVEQGKINLDEPAAKYLSELSGWAGKITIRQILHHTSGMPDYYDTIEEKYSAPTNAQALKFLKQLSTLEFSPGTQYSYSNAGYDTLGALIERVSGQSFSDFMQLNIFGPSGMTKTFAFDRKLVETRKRAVGYDKIDGKYELDDSSELNDLHGSGSIYSTPADMAQYDVALFGGKLLSAASLKEMFTSGALNNKESTEYGFGWEVGYDDEVSLDYYGHSGEWMGYASYYLHYPAKNLSVIVLANASTADPEGVASAAAKLLLAP